MHPHKQFNPVYVRDPRTDGYSVIVHPCQDIVLTLTDPINTFDKGTSEDSWEVKAYSDYLYLAGVKELPGKKQYRFIQFYDLSRWTDVSNVYLGDIDISLNGKNVSENFSLCVLAKKNSNQQCRIITAVNPAVNRIKVQDDDILEVVVYRHDAAKVEEEVWCALYDTGKNGVGNGSQWFERLRQETLVLPETAPLRNDRNSLFFTMSRDVANLSRNPWLPKNKELPPVPEKEVQRQHHFWFRVRPEDKEAVAKANKGQPLANIVFNSSGGSCSNLQVLISTRTPKKGLIVGEYDKDRYDGAYRGLVGRYSSPIGGLLINPGKVEGVEILPKQNGVMVELAPPVMTWPYTDPGNRWACEVEPVMYSDFLSNKSGARRVTCVELLDRNINQQPIQRFLIKPETHDIPHGDSMCFLGVVNFICTEPSVIGKRTLNCWLVRERTSKEEYDEFSPERYRDLLPIQNVKRRTSSVTPGAHHSKPLRYSGSSASNYRPRVEKIRVEISEEREDGLLTKGCFTTTFSSIKVDKKKEAEVSKVTVQDYREYQAAAAKKKEVVGVRNLASQSEGTKSIKPFQQFSGGSQVGKMADDSFVICESPCNYDVIGLKPGQTAIVRMPINFWQLKNDVDYFWNVNPIQIRKQNFWIQDIRLMRQGKRMWQEIVIALVHPQLPKEVGTHRMGALRIHNKHEHVYVLVEVNIENTDFPEKTSAYSQALREMMEGWRQLKERRDKEGLRVALEKYQANKPTPQAQQDQAGSVCLVLRDNWPKNKTAKVGLQDLVKVVLPKRISSLAHPAGTSECHMLSWSLKKLPLWLDVQETKETNEENTFIFVVEHTGKGLIAPLDDIRFACGDEYRTFQVQLDLERYLIALGS